MWCVLQRDLTKDSFWSWVVCLSATISTALMFGFALSFGVYQPYLMEYFDENKERTSWTGSIVVGLILFSGPFAVVLTDRLGHRIVGMTCGFVCAISVMASSFVKNLTLLYLSFSVLYGFAGGIILNVGYTMIQLYFRKYWHVAVGIVSSGSAIGMLLITQLSEFLIEVVGWRHTFQIMSGMLILISIASLSYYPISAQEEEVDLDPENVKLQDQSNVKHLKGRQTNPSQELDVQELNMSATKEENVPIQEREPQNEKQKEEDKEEEEEGANVYTEEMKQGTLLLEKSTTNDFYIREGNDCVDVVAHEKKDKANEKVGVHEKRKKMTFKDVLSLFKNVYFVFGLINTTLINFGLYSPHIHLMQFALDLGMSHRNSAQLYIYFAIVGIISRIASGHLASKVKLSPLALLQLSEGLCGISLLFLSLAKTNGHLVGFSIAYGTGQGCFITFQVLFYMSVVEPVKSGLSLGVAYLVGSIAVISGPPFAGFIADRTGSYVTSFFVIGGIMVFASIFPCIIHIKKRICK